MQASAADRAHEWLRGELLAGRYPPSELITEGQVADAVGVSRTPVREALLRLQAEGFVRLLPKRGALVLPVTPDQAADVMETRRLLETYAVRKAAAAPVEDGTRSGLVARLEEQLAAMRRAADERDVRAYVEADRCFHAAIVAATGNTILESLYRSLRDRQLRIGSVTVAADGGGGGTERLRRTLDEHESIADAIARGAVSGAQAAVDAHLDSATQRLTKHWRRA